MCPKNGPINEMEKICLVYITAFVFSKHVFIIKCRTYISANKIINIPKNCNTLKSEKTCSTFASKRNHL